MDYSSRLLIDIDHRPYIHSTSRHNICLPAIFATIFLAKGLPAIFASQQLASTARARPGRGRGAGDFGPATRDITDHTKSMKPNST